MRAIEEAFRRRRAIVERMRGTEGEGKGLVAISGAIAGRLDEDHAFVYMDALRAVAAILVLVTHVRDLVFVDYRQATTITPVAKIFYVLGASGHPRTILFFVLSGFWITRVVVRREQRPTFWTDYLLDRLTRFWVVLIPALALGGLIDWAGLRFVGGPVYAAATGAHSLGRPIAQTLDAAHLASNLVFLQGLVTDSFGSNGPLWSLAYEFWFYLWFPALWFLLRRRRVSVALFSLTLAFVFPALTQGFAAWMFGSALFFALDHLRALRESRLRVWFGPVMGVGGLVASLVVAGTAKFLGSASLLLDLALAASYSVMLAGLIVGNPRIAPGVRLVARYGVTSSFSLYATHFPLVVLLAAMVLPGRRLEPDLHATLILVAISIVAIGQGWLFSRATERHTRRVRAWCRDRLRLPPSDGAGGQRVAKSA